MPYEDFREPFQHIFDPNNTICKQDYEAMAAHLVKIHESLREQGDTLKRFRAEIE